MPKTGFSLRLPPSLLLPMAAGIVLAAAMAQSARAEAGERYILPEGEGYGIGDCMRAGNDCGKVMADSWCEAHGHTHALAYGSSDDVTGAIKSSDRIVQVAAGSVVIRCGD